MICLSNHDSRVRSQWERYNLPRYISLIYWIYIRINQQGVLNTAESAKRLVIFVRFAVVSIVGYDNPHLPCGVPKIGKLMVHTTTVTGIYVGFMVDISTAFYGFINQKTWLAVGPLKETFFFPAPVQHLWVTTPLHGTMIHHDWGCFQ